MRSIRDLGFSSLTPTLTLEMVLISESNRTTVGAQTARKLCYTECLIFQNSLSLSLHPPSSRQDRLYVADLLEHPLRLTLMRHRSVWNTLAETPGPQSNQCAAKTRRTLSRAWDAPAMAATIKQDYCLIPQLARGLSYHCPAASQALICFKLFQAGCCL